MKPKRKALSTAALASTAIIVVIATSLAVAHADISPLGTTTGHATGMPFDISRLVGECSTADVAGTIVSGRQISARLTVSGTARATCSLGTTYTLTVTTRGSMTIGVVSSTSGVGATADVTLDRDFDMTFYFILANCSWRVAGPQGPFRGAAVFNQGTQTMTLTLPRMAATSTGGSCGTPVEITITTRFAMTPRFTIS
jgi:hypothetical protein